ncbi:MAG: hypothetical protein KY397_00805 [Gemmatimonadetes bacterium]|nr:hypothetical protein [Gemmatimonadota bacterium]
MNVTAKRLSTLNAGERPVRAVVKSRSGSSVSTIEPVLPGTVGILQPAGSSVSSGHSTVIVPFSEMFRSQSTRAP